MVIQIEKIGKGFTKTPHEHLTNARNKTRNCGVKVLAVTQRDAKRAEAIRSKLGIEEIRVCQTLDEVLEATSSLDNNRVVAGVIEIQRHDGAMPLQDIQGKKIRGVDHVLEMPVETRLGRVDVETALGTSCLVLVSELPSDPLLREIALAGADPTAIMIARPYGKS